MSSRSTNMAALTSDFDRYSKICSQQHIHPCVLPSVCTREVFGFYNLQFSETWELNLDFWLVHNIILLFSVFACYCHGCPFVLDICAKERRWCSDSEVRPPDLASISDFVFLLLPSRDMTERLDLAPWNTKFHSIFRSVLHDPEGPVSTWESRAAGTCVLHTPPHTKCPWAAVSPLAEWPPNTTSSPRPGPQCSGNPSGPKVIGL